MLLRTRHWGPEKPGQVVCLHGLTQHAGVFDGLAKSLAAQDLSVLGIDLRGHGGSRAEPPWNTETHVQDVIETLEEQGVERALWIGHSYGGRVAAALAAMEPERTAGLALLESPSRVPADRALQAIEIGRLDWSFATVDGALEALLSSDLMLAPPREVVAAFVRDDVRRGADGRYRFRVSPGAVVVAWSEMTLPPPPIAHAPTLLLCAASPLADTTERDTRYREVLGELLTRVEVPNGHNVLWEAPAETSDAIRKFVSQVLGP